MKSHGPCFTRPIHPAPGTTLGRDISQQFREATAWGEGPRFLIRDRDGKFSAQSDAVLEACGTKVLLTPPRQPTCNAFAERWVRTARDELFHHVLVWGEQDLRDKLGGLIGHYHARPHQGLDQRSPNEVTARVSSDAVAETASADAPAGSASSNATASCVASAASAVCDSSDTARRSASPRSPPARGRLEHVSGPFHSEPVLGGLHRRYLRVA